MARARWSRLPTLCLLPTVWAAEAVSAQDTLQIEYAVKIICGAPDRRAVAPGTYFTAINVHNPGADTIRFRKKFALTAAGEEPGPISGFSPNGLAPDQALEIDCTDIFRRTRTRFAKGFAVIQSPAVLDVVAVYTAVGSTGRVETMHLERVPGRRGTTGDCPHPDLVVDSIMRPEWDDANKRSVIRAAIRNIGTATAPPTTARIVDPSTPGPGGTPQSATASAQQLAPGASDLVTFYLPYWVFNPDATLEVTADHNNAVRECREDNNTSKFEALG